MRKFLLLSITLSFALQLSAQNERNEKESTKYFRLGNEAFYDKSDFTGAINNYNQALFYFLKPEYYLKRGQVYLAKSDSCPACRDFYTAAVFGNVDADKKWKQMCVKSLTVKDLSSSLQARLANPAKTVVFFEPCSYDTIISEIGVNVGDEPIWPKADVPPKIFASGEDVIIQKLIEQNLTPKLQGISRDDVPTGLIMVTFIVEKDGSSSEIIVDGINPNYHAAVIEFIKTLPKYRPAKKNGVPIRYKHKFPIPLLIR